VIHRCYVFHYLQMKHREVLQSQERLNDQRVLLENLERQLETRTVTAIVTEKSSTQKPSSGFSHDAQLLSLLGMHCFVQLVCHSHP
jgi:hypothetical protein